MNKKCQRFICSRKSLSVIEHVNEIVFLKKPFRCDNKVEIKTGPQC